MYRLFDEHKIRQVKELTGELWDFHAVTSSDNAKTIKVAVPSSWQSYPDTVCHVGKGIYEKDVYCGGNVRFVFKGVAHTADVFLDGKKIAHHYNAFTEFDAVVKNLTEGMHHLEVVADNTLDENSALHVENDYFNYGGITRPVVMESIGDLFVKRTFFEPILSGDKWGARVKVVISNLSESEKSGTLTVSFAHKDHRTNICEKRIFFESSGCADVTLELEFEDIDVKPWNPEAPCLYDLVATITDDAGQETDDLKDRVGFRVVEVRDNKIFINGEQIKIKGLCRHEEHPMFGSSLPVTAMEQDLMILKDLGANSVRTTHYPNDERFLDLCDEQGILVWEENHARGLSEEQMRNPHFEEQAEDCIKEMINSHYNHPSIYIWGILNECSSDTEYGAQCYKKQYDLIKELDSTRPRSSASCKFKTDICFGYPEVVSYNIYPLWYHNTDPKEYLDDLYNWIQTDTEGKDKPFLITEIGAGAIYGFRSNMSVKWSEEYQAKALERQLKAVLGSDYCSGVYIWQFCDGKVSDEWWNIRPRTMNNKGVVDEYRRPKLAYEVVKRIFNEVGV